jgi:hypothetical protein
MAESTRELQPPRRPEPLVESRVETRAPSEHELDRVAARRTASRNPLDEEGDVMSLDAGVPSPAPAPTTPTPTPAPATPAANCAVKSGPSYSVTGTVPVTTSNHKKKAPFDFTASFTTDASKGAKPSCCEVRQYVKWDKAFQDWRKGPIHSGFPSTATYDTWYEDRDKSDTRYGHRSGAYSSPVAKCGDEYKTGTTQDMANGDTYCGHDGPNGPDTLTGTWNFQLKVVDTCDGDKEKASSAVITVNW